VAKIQFLIDENLPPSYRDQLLRRRAQLVVRGIGELGVPAKGTLDPDILLWCEENNFLLVTDNRRSMPRHLSDHLAAGRQIPGILVLRSQAGMGEIIEELLLIAGVGETEDFQNSISFIPL
jgi:Domain of unknown function (DUF5615)